MVNLSTILRRRLVSEPEQDHSHKMAAKVSVISRCQKTYLWLVIHCGDFFEEGRHLFGQEGNG